MRDDSAETLFQFFFLLEALMSSSGMGQGCPLFDAVRLAFPLPTSASPCLQGALKDGFGEAVVACYVPEPSKFPSLDSFQERFMRTRIQSQVNSEGHTMAKRES